MLHELAIAVCGQGMEVRDEVEGLVSLLLEAQELPHGTVVVPKMKASRGLNTGEDAHSRKNARDDRAPLNIEDDMGSPTILIPFQAEAMEGDRLDVDTLLMAQRIELLADGLGAQMIFALAFADL